MNIWIGISLWLQMILLVIGLGVLLGYLKDERRAISGAIMLLLGCLLLAYGLNGVTYGDVQRLILNRFFLGGGVNNLGEDIGQMNAGRVYIIQLGIASLLNAGFLAVMVRHDASERSKRTCRFCREVIPSECSHDEKIENGKIVMDSIGVER